MAGHVEGYDQHKIETFGHDVLVAANIDTKHDVPFVLRSNHHVTMEGSFTFFRALRLGYSDRHKFRQPQML